MTAAAPASVIVASRGRPAALIRCLTALRQLDHPRVEVIVVADTPGLEAVEAAGLSQVVKTACCDDANVARARNIGIAAAAGTVCAFIDDDAVPEPTWLSRLCAPFGRDDVAAAGGFVRGRNGISFQWRARQIDTSAREPPLAVAGDAVSLHRGTPGRAIRTEGTCCAFRRDLLAAMGGFDPAFAFYLDDADVNMRLAAARHVTAIVPDAEVHHGFLASERRRADRVPTTLHAIGRSVAVFVRKHGGDMAAALARLRAEQRRRLLRHMVAGRLMPGDLRPLLDTLEDGIVAGRGEPLVPPATIPPPGAPFLRLQGTGRRHGVVLAGRAWERRRLHRAAVRAVGDRAVVTVFRLSPTAFFHRMRFCEAGYWEQTGGLFGRSVRAGPLIRPIQFQRRIAEETARIARVRPVGSAETLESRAPQVQ